VNQDSHEERLRSAVDAIVPADGFPSASQAGCLRFWDAMLAGERPEWWRRVGAVLDLLDVAAGGSFPELDQEQQHGVLERLAADPDYVWFASMTNYAFMPSQQHGRCWAGDQVGRHLQGHLDGGSLGIFDDPVNDYVGPGPSIATNDFRHFNAGLVGGAMIANEFVPTPIGAFCYLHATPGLLPLHGPAAKAGMRRLISRMQRVVGPGTCRMGPIPAGQSSIRTGGSGVMKTCASLTA
jgi:hypothetical protein